jgi:hypothetical protein
MSVRVSVRTAAFNPKMIGALANSLFHVLHCQTSVQPLAKLGSGQLGNSEHEGFRWLSPTVSVRQSLVRPVPHFGLNRQAHRYRVRTVKNFEQVIAGQAAKLAAFAGPGYQLDTSIAGMALRTGDIGFSHGCERYHLCERDHLAPSISAPIITSYSQAC